VKTHNVGDDVWKVEHTPLCLMQCFFWPDGIFYIVVS